MAVGVPQWHHSQPVDLPVEWLLRVPVEWLLRDDLCASKLDFGTCQARKKREEARKAAAEARALQDEEEAAAKRARRAARRSAVAARARCIQTVVSG